MLLQAAGADLATIPVSGPVPTSRAYSGVPACLMCPPQEVAVPDTGAANRSWLRAATSPRGTPSSVSCGASRSWPVVVPAVGY